MTDYAQARRLMAVSTPLGDDALLLVGFHGRAAMSELFKYDLELLVENGTRIDFAALLGQPVLARVTPFPGLTRYYSGIVAQLTRGERDQTFTRYQAEVRPKAWLLTQNVQSRVFQHLSGPDIVRQVLLKVLTLDEFVFSNLNGDYQPRDYCVQYRESDFAFISRLMEEEGISFYFRHSEQGHQMVITDTPFDKLDPIEAKLTFDPVDGGERTEPHIRSWAVSQAVRTQQFVVRDHTFALPDQDLEAAQAVQPRVKVGAAEHDLTCGSAELEIYDYPGGYAGRYDGVGPGGSEQSGELRKIFADAQRTARIRMESESVQAIRIEGGSTCAAFHPGYHFELTRHPDGDGAYLISRVEHFARLSGYRSGEELKVEYRNQFSSVPKGLAYRPPRRTPKPTIASTQTAVVVGPPGQEAFLDKYGRVKVQFYWDRQGKKDADSSCWVRVAQIWAGKGWGAFFWPRIGQEVVVAFDEGDPDRPLIVGSVYNEQNRPPFFPVEPLVNGIRSCSSFGHAHDQSNGLLFHDERGHEHLQVHSERNEVFHTESSKHVQVGQNLITIVGGLGAGRSDDGSGSGAGDDKPVLFYEAEVPARFGMTVQATFGAQVSFASFYQANYVVGHTMTWVVNPTALATPKLFGWGGIAPPSGPWGWVAGLGGQQQFILGTQTNIQYGPAINIQRGSSLEYSGDLKLRHALTAAGIGAVGMATALLSGKEFGFQSHFGIPEVVTGISGTAVSTWLNAIYTGLETKEALANSGLSKAEEAEDTLLHVEPLLIPRLMPGMNRIAILTAKDAIDTATRAAGHGSVLPGQRSDITDSYQADYTIQARHITLYSDDPRDPEAGRPGAPTTISLVARGNQVIGAKPSDGGSVRVSATTAIDVRCFDGPIKLTAPSDKEESCIVLRQGKYTGGDMGRLVSLSSDGILIGLGVQFPLPIGPRIDLSADGITLAVGPAATGASITLTQKEIALKVNQWQLRIGPTGIAMNVGPSEVSVVPDGVMIKGLAYALECNVWETDARIMMTEKVGGVVKREAAIENVQ